MTQCLICKTNISSPAQQFGDVKMPICQSDWLNGNSWIYNEPIITDALQRGFTLGEACAIELDERNRKFTEELQRLFIEVEEVINQTVTA